MIRALHPQKPKLVVIWQRHGRGEACSRTCLACDPTLFDITVFGDEPYGNYNRNSAVKRAATARRTRRNLPQPARVVRRKRHHTTRGETCVTGIDREAKTVHARRASSVPYDYLVFATGSKPFIPPIPGTPLHGVFAFRTLDDCRNIAEYAKRCKTAVVIGGGLLGLEAAKGLMTHNVEVTVVEMAPWLMNVQLDEAGGKVLSQTHRETRHQGTGWHRHEGVARAPERNWREVRRRDARFPPIWW